MRPFLPGLLLMLVCGAARAGDNLLANGDFESGATGWNLFIPDESQGRGCHFDIVQDSPHGGVSCARLQADDFARYAIGGHAFNVAAGDRYRVTAWVRADPQTQVRQGGAGFVIRLTLHGPTGTTANNFNIVMGNRVGLGNVTPPSDSLPTVWTKVEAVVEIPANVDSVGPDIFVHYAKGPVFVDDVAIEKVDASTATTPVAGSGGAGASSSSSSGPPATTDDYLMNAFDFDAPGMEKVKAAVQANNLAGAQKAYLDYRRTANPAKWKITAADQPAKPIAQDDPVADDVAAHKVHNFWYDAMVPKIADMGVGGDFQWFRNPLPTTDPNYTTNWMGCVISRTQFWENLSDAYWRTQNEKYAQAWVEQLESFAKNVPLDYNHNESVNYNWSPLSAANRMFESWPYAYYHFLNSSSFTPEANWIYTKEIRDHALNLMAGLNENRTGNWITAECCGLYTLGVLYPEIKESVQWRQVATDRFLVELNKLVPPDGFEAELSPGYDTSTMEQFTTPTELAPLNHIKLPDLFRTKLLSMYQALVLDMDQAGNVVPTNDSWIINAISLAPRGLKLADDPLLEWAASRGRKGQAPPDSTMLPYAGFYAMRSGWKRNDIFLFFRGGPIGIGHQHEEDLEVVLRAWNKTLLFDPGTYSYDKSEFRRYVLGTSSHSTVLVDDKWQHAGTSPVPTEPVANPWAATPLFDYVASTFDKGYQENVYAPIQYSPMRWVGSRDMSITHTRRVLFLRPYYALVLDTLDGTGTHTYDSLFQMDAPSAVVDPATHAVVSRRTDGVQLALYPLDQDNLTVEVVEGQKNPLLGWYPIQQRATPTARFHKQQAAPAIFATFLYPYQGSDQPAFQSGALAAQGDDLWTQSVTTPNEKAEVAVVKNDKTEAISISSTMAGTVQVSASGWLIRQSAGGTQVWQGGWGVQSYQDAHTSFTVDKPAALVFGVNAHDLDFYNGGDHPVVVTFTQPLTAAATIPPGAWTEIDGKGTASAAATAPVLFPPLLAKSTQPAYADYLNAQPGAAGAAPASINLKSGDFTLSSGVALGMKLGSDSPIITKWNAIDATATAQVNVAQAGWYHFNLRYCSGGGCVISLLVNGQPPFEEAEGIPLDTTRGALPSDGWSNLTDDWHTLTLGSDMTPDGWKIYLPAGDNQITLRQDGGAGANLASLTLAPAKP